MNEWGFLIKSNQDINIIINIVEKHNKLDINNSLRGDTLCIYSIIQCNDDKKNYLCLTNKSGEDRTTEFILLNYNNSIVYFPYSKPKWWYKKNKYTLLWEVKNNLDQIVLPWK